MKIILFLSEAVVPLILFLLIISGLSKRINLYEDFIKGAKDGFRTVIGILPTLIGLMVATGVLRASGFLEFLSSLGQEALGKIGFPTELVPITIVKLFSSSAATGLLLDLYKEYGTDSRIGTMVSIMLSSTETVFYTMSVYLMSVRVRKSRYTLAGALVATFAGVAASVWITNMIFSGEI